MNTRMLKRISCWIISSLLCLAFMGQTTLGEENPDTSPTTLKLCSLPFLSFAPIFIAIEEGYFAEQGLEIEPVKFRTGHDAVPALAQGQIDVLAGGISAGLFNAIARGLNIKIVADKGHLEPEDRSAALVVRKELYDSGKFRSLHDLEGHRMSLFHPGSNGYFIADLILRETNLTFENIETIHLSQPETFQALTTGALDVALMWEPRLTRIKATDCGVVFAYLGEMYDFIYPSSQMATILFGPNLLNKQPELGRRFILAYLRGVRTYNQGKTDRNLEIIGQYTGLTRELLLQSGFPRIHSDGRLDNQSILTFQNWLYKNGFIDQVVSAEEIVDTSFTDWANKELSKQE